MYSSADDFVGYTTFGRLILWIYDAMVAVVSIVRSFFSS
jgi:hypothetical protein